MIIESIFNWFGLSFSNLMLFLLYITPLLICLLVYTFRAILFYKNDLQNCSNRYYQPSLRLGTVVWFFFLSVTPCVNIFALVFDCMGSLFAFVTKTLSVPFVRPQYKPEKKNES